MIDTDQFTVLQLLNMARQFQRIASTGTISTKAFVDCLSKTALLSQSMDLLPENYLFAQLHQFQQVIHF